MGKPRRKYKFLPKSETARKKRIRIEPEDPSEQPPLKKSKPLPEVSDVEKLLDFSPNVSADEQLDPDGDVVIALDTLEPGSQARYLVSSRILSVASPVFSKMFSPKFTEGTKVRNGDMPCINLKEDNAEAMAIILRIMHYRNEDIPRDIRPVKLAFIALLCDKYDCKRALAGWIETWCSSRSFNNSFSTSHPIGMGFALLAAYKFHLNSTFLTSLASRASKFLGHDFQTRWDWCDAQFLGHIRVPIRLLLPEPFADAMVDHIHKTRRRLLTSLNWVDEFLQKMVGSFKVSPSQRICSTCDTIYYTKDSKTCPCTGSIDEKRCTKDSRVAKYFRLLKEAGLYPHSEELDHLSVDEVFRKIEATVKSASRHRCSGGHVKCPLAKALKTVLDDALAIRLAVDFEWVWK